MVNVRVVLSPVKNSGLECVRIVWHREGSLHFRRGQTWKLGEKLCTPLLNRSGQVVGIVTGIVNPTRQEVFIGIGFAVRIQVAAAAAGSPPY